MCSSDLGTALVQLGAVPPLAYLASIPVGALATAVLVVNNIRDRHTDVTAGKRTLAVRFGKRAGLIEYATLLAAAYLTPVAVVLLLHRPAWALLPLVSAPRGIQLLRSLATNEGRPLNEVLVGTAKLVLLYAVLFSAGLALPTP